MTPTLQTTLITGASSGIGAVYADRLARRGSDLILVARSRERLEALSARIAYQTGRKVKVVTADLADSGDLARIEDILRSDSRINALVNNAGVGGTAGALLDSDVDAMTRLIALNVTALTRLTYAAVPRFVKQGNGLVINIASIVAIQPELLNGVYGGSKAYVVGFTRSLHHELAKKGIRFQAVLPGAIATEFWSADTLEHFPKEIVMTADDLVDASLAGLDLGELITVPSVPDAKDLAAYEAARAALIPNLSHREPAARYGLPRFSAV